MRVIHHRRAVPDPTENVRSTLLTFPCRSFTLTVSVARSSIASGFSSFHYRTPSAAGLNFPASSVPAGTPSISVSAITEKLLPSSPV